MPVEIRELQITAVVQDTGTHANASAASPVNPDMIIAECVEQVLQILKQKGER